MYPWLQIEHQSDSVVSAGNVAAYSDSTSAMSCRASGVVNSRFLRSAAGRLFELKTPATPALSLEAISGLPPTFFFQIAKLVSVSI